MKVVSKKYNIKGSINKNIVLISDMHYSDKSDIKHLNKVLDYIKKLNPSYICIPGDITDNTYVKDEELLIDWFNRLSNIYL